MAALSLYGNRPGATDNGYIAMVDFFIQAME